MTKLDELEDRIERLQIDVGRVALRGVSSRFRASLPMGGKSWVTVAPLGGGLESTGEGGSGGGGCVWSVQEESDEYGLEYRPAQILSYYQSGNRNFPPYAPYCDFAFADAFPGTSSEWDYHGFIGMEALVADLGDLTPAILGTYDVSGIVFFKATWKDISNYNSYFSGQTAEGYCHYTYKSTILDSVMDAITVVNFPPGEVEFAEATQTEEQIVGGIYDGMWRVRRGYPLPGRAVHSSDWAVPHYYTNIWTGLSYCATLFGSLKNWLLIPRFFYSEYQKQSLLANGP